MMMTRREFAAGLGGALATWGFGGCRSFGGGCSYSVSVLGDMHYDAFPMEHFHKLALANMKAGEKDNPGRLERRLREYRRNAAMWQGLSNRILAASGALRRPDAAFALQLGDLIQGDCDEVALHRQMLTEAAGLLEKAYPGLPVVLVCGNHDVRTSTDSMGAVEAYGDFFRPFESRQLARWFPDGVKSTTFGFRQGPDLWIDIDFTSYGRQEEIDIVKRLLADNADARYTFVVSHGPLLPMPYWKCRWFYLGEERNADARRELRALLAKRDAIVLAGHEHTLVLKEWEGDGGRITEMTLNNCAGRAEGGFFPSEPDVLLEGTDQLKGYTAALKSDLRPLYEEYRPGMRRFYAARAVGHHILRVDDSSVELDYYGHDARVPTKTFRLA